MSGAGGAWEWVPGLGRNLGISWGLRGPREGFLGARALMQLVPCSTAMCVCGKSVGGHHRVGSGEPHRAVAPLKMRLGAQFAGESSRGLSRQRVRDGDAGKAGDGSLSSHLPQEDPRGHLGDGAGVDWRPLCLCPHPCFGVRTLEVSQGSFPETCRTPKSQGAGFS